MAFQKGIAANPTGKNGSPGKQAITKAQRALNKAIDLLGLDTLDGCGTTVLAGLISEKLKEDPIGTLKALSSILPKAVEVDVQHSNSARSLTDDELADIIATRARIRHDEKHTIEGEAVVISDKSKACVDK